jgi:hypothetical protein
MNLTRKDRHRRSTFAVHFNSILGAADGQHGSRGRHQTFRGGGASQLPEDGTQTPLFQFEKDPGGF